MNKYIKRTLLSVISLVLVTCILAFATFEGFGNSFSVFGKTFMSDNSIIDNTCNLKFWWSDNPSDNSWKDTENSTCNVSFDSDILWEPGHCEIRYFKVDNTDTCDFGYDFRIKIEEESLPQIADIISVYYLDDATTKVSSVSGFTSKGSLADCYVDTIYHCDELSSGNSKVCALAFVMNSDAGNTYQGSANHVSFSILVNPLRIEEPEPEVTGEFGVALPDRDILYRVGTYNSVPFTTLFYANDTSGGVNSNFDYDKITFSYPTQTDATNRIAGKAYASFTRNRTFTSSTFSFGSSGVLTIDMLYDGQVKASLNLEVIDGANNVTVSTASPSASSRDTVLLTDVNTSSSSVSGNKTLYGNGFKIIDVRTDTSGNVGVVNMSGGSIDNVRIIGQDFSELVTFGNTNQQYADALTVNSGNNYVYNTYITGCRFSTFITGYSKSFYAENTVFSGGTFANLAIAVGNVTLKNCITSNSATNSLRGLGIYIQTTGVKLTLEGTFTQYNWINKNQVPEVQGLSSILNGYFGSGSSYPFCKTYNGTQYLNPGIALSDGASGFTEVVSRTCVTDNTNNSYHFKTEPYMGVTATLYSIYAADTTDDMVIKSISPIGQYDFDQYPTLPATSFDFTNLNYIAKTADSNKYCYYDSNSDTVYISFESTESSFPWNPMILTASKYGSNIPYTVRMNGTTYSGNINFTDSGEYSVEYIYTDNQYYYSSSAVNSSRQYSKVVNISVTVCDPAVVTYPPQFTFGSDGSYSQASKTVVVNNKTYVMPDVGATSSSIGSTVVDGQTIYYPKVNVPATSSNGNSTYQSGKIYFYSPAFSSVRIVDYNQNNGATAFTYNTSCTTWPHGQSASEGPDTQYLSYVSGMPYEGSGGATYRKFGSNNKGVCYTTNEFERDVNASNQLVCFKYHGQDGNDYYYYIYYSYPQTTYSSCLAEGTDITLSDGNVKKIENLAFFDRIKTWNFFEGKSETEDVCLIVNHGTADYTVLNMKFKDGTELRTIGEHGLFDYDLNRFVYISPDNYNNYIGHRFVKLKANGRYKKVKLIDAYVTDEYTTAYSLTSSHNSNAVANGMLTVAPPDDFYNWIEMGGKLQYNKETFEKDVLTYGLYDYRVFENYVTYDQYEAFNGKYLKIAVDKGLISFESIVELIEQYSKYMK